MFRINPIVICSTCRRRVTRVSAESVSCPRYAGPKRLSDCAVRDRSRGDFPGVPARAARYRELSP